MAEIAVKNLIKVYQVGELEVHALRGLNMNVAKGEIVSIIGPSGSGKTTLLNIIGGLDAATAGSVKVSDVEVTSLSLNQLVDYRRRYVGHVFQNRNLIPTLTARENVELPMLALSASKSGREERSEMLLEAMGLSESMDRKPDELSGGEQQRVAVAVALANNPPVILGDEPTGELDARNARVVTDFLVKVNNEFGKTIVFVTHDPNVARAADRVLLITDGAIREEHRPSRIIEKASESYNLSDRLRTTLYEVESAMEKLDEEFRSGVIDGDTYADRRIVLRETKVTILKELHKIGVI